MSAGQVPSGPNFWDSNAGKGVIYGGTGIYGVSQMVYNERQNHHQRVQRSLERVTKLTVGKLNPAQYVLEASRDNVPSSFIKQDLLSWAGDWNDTDFSKPELFDVIDQPPTSIWRSRERSCRLMTRPVDKGVESQSEFASFDTRLSSVSTAGQEGEKTLTKNLGLRGGSTEAMEVQGVTKNGIDVATGRSKHCANLAYEVCEEQVQAVPDRPFTRTYEFTSPRPLHPVFYYLFALGFICGSAVLVNFVQRKFSKWLDSQESQGPASTVEENSSVEALERPSGEEAGSATKAKPEFVIETFLAYKRRLISKRKAAYILVKYYNLSEVEVLELLDD